MPASTALVFVIGLAVSSFVGTRTSAALDHLLNAEYPYLEQIGQVERGQEKFRVGLKAAVDDADVDELKAVVAAPLADALAAYQKLAVSITEARLTTGTVAD